MREGAYRSDASAHDGPRHFGVGNVIGMVSVRSQHLSTSGNGVVLTTFSMHSATGSGSVFSTIFVLLILPFTSTVDLDLHGALEVRVLLLALGVALLQLRARALLEVDADRRALVLRLADDDARGFAGAGASRRRRLRSAPSHAERRSTSGAGVRRVAASAARSSGAASPPAARACCRRTRATSNEMRTVGARARSAFIFVMVRSLRRIVLGVGRQGLLEANRRSPALLQHVEDEPGRQRGDHVLERVAAHDARRSLPDLRVEVLERLRPGVDEHHHEELAAPRIARLEEQHHQRQREHREELNEEVEREDRPRRCSSESRHMTTLATPAKTNGRSNMRDQ